MDQFTSVLLSFMTVAVHCEVESTVTSAGVHETVIVGVTAVEVEPQALRTASAAVMPKKKRTRSQRALPRSKRKFGSNTRHPPARPTLIFLRKIQILPRKRACNVLLAPHARSRLPLECAAHFAVSDSPLRPSIPAAAESPLPHTRNQPGCNRLRNWTESHSPRGIDAAPHHCVACRKAECDNRPLPPDKVKRNLHSAHLTRRVRMLEKANGLFKVYNEITIRRKIRLRHLERVRAAGGCELI